MHNLIRIGTFVLASLAAGVASILFILGPVAVPTTSMNPSIGLNEKVWIWKAGYSLGLAAPSRGDIVLFEAPTNSQKPGALFIKRVVALEGDTIEIKDNKLVLNGTQMRYGDVMRDVYEESAPDNRRQWVRLRPGKAPLNMPAIVVPKGHMFILGDNRGNSEDSRTWGPVEASRIKGVAVGLGRPS